FCAIARRRGPTGSTKSTLSAIGSSSTSRARRQPFSLGTGSTSQAATQRSLTRWRQSQLYALHFRAKRLPPGRLCVWVFDVLEFNGIYLRSEPGEVAPTSRALVAQC